VYYKEDREGASRMKSCQLVVFNLGTEEYAIDISYAKEIIRVPKLAKIPNVPYFIEGIFNLRGTVITVIDLKKRFEIEETEDNVDRRLLILDFNEMKVGIIVDDISEVMRVEDLEVQNLGNEIVNISKNSIDGITIINDRLILLLNALRLKSEIFKYCSGEEMKHD
jgi:purine-binding chemotaxis protein CheW